MNKHMFAQPATRKNYSDIPGQYDRMGQVGAWGAPGVMPGFAGPGFPGGLPGLVAATSNPGLSAAFAAQAAGAGFCNAEQPSNSYERPIGLPRICIDGCDCELIETTVCAPFTLLTIFIAPKVAFNLSITRLQVGCNNLLMSCDPIPAELFSCCEADKSIITAPTVAANSKFCMEVQNECQREVEFKGSFTALVCTTC